MHRTGPNDDVISTLIGAEGRSEPRWERSIWRSPVGGGRERKCYVGQFAIHSHASCASSSAFGDQLNHNVIFITSRLTHSMRSSTRTKGTSRARRGRIRFGLRALAFAVVGPATPGRNNGASGTGGAVCGAVGFGHEEEDDDAAANIAVES